MSDLRRGNSEKDRDTSDKNRGGTPEPNRRRDTRTNSMSSQPSRAGLEESLSTADIRESKKQSAISSLTQNFCAVTLSMNAFYKQVCYHANHQINQCGAYVYVFVCRIQSG